MREVTELKPIRESTEDYEAIESVIRKKFLILLYRPLFRAFSTKTVQNASPKSPLTKAVASGKVWLIERYGVGFEFKGELSASISKELKAIGAEWIKGRFIVSSDKMSHVLYSDLKDAERSAIQKFARAADKLVQNLPAEITGAIKVEKYFDRALLKVEKQFQGSVKDFLLPATLTPEARRKIAAEWQDNLERFIKDFAEEEVAKLRKQIQKSTFKGNRYDSVVKAIKTSYGVTERKAKFLARQETGLLMTKFKESRYTGSGIQEYKWRCVAGSPAHPVRPSHKALDGKVFRWDTPPITTSPNEPVRRNNPGEDFNCRCMAVPLVKFK